MLAEPLLKSFPMVRTRDTDEVRAWLKPMFSVRDLDMPDRGRRFDCILNHCKLPGIALTYAQYGSRFNARLEQNDFFVQGFPISGSGEVRWNRSVKSVRLEAGGVAGGPGASATLAYDDEFSHLILKVSPTALTHRLSLLVDKPVEPPLQLTGWADPQVAAAQARLISFLAQELERTQGRLPGMVIAELEDAILVNFLLANQHNYSRLLTGVPRAAAPWQVRRAVDYMERHWDQAITIEKLTQITETSARSLFQLFKKTHDISPMVYLSKVRLRHARDMLSRPAPGISVTKVGFMCGFSNLGHFAMKYFAAFGEKPSDTLRNSLR